MTVFEPHVAIVLDVDTFWTIVAFVVIGAIGAVVGFVFYYWFVIIPKRVLGP
jgi:H+/Cl- antiporter ClcA